MSCCEKPVDAVMDLVAGCVIMGNNCSLEGRRKAISCVVVGQQLLSGCLLEQSQCLGPLCEALLFACAVMVPEAKASGW